MSRSLLNNIHLNLAALFAPLPLMLAFSSGLYLLGARDIVGTTTVQISADKRLDFDSTTLQADVENTRNGTGVSHKFEYIKHKKLE
ncbi:MAG: hypothetical protein AAF542_18800 [Pseudomonadota bacterium]